MYKIAMFSAAVFAIIPSFLSASEITLTIKDQDVQIIGEFVGFQQDAYVVRTADGELFVPAGLVDCEGVDCLVIVASE